MTSKVQPCCRLLNIWPWKPGDEVELFWYLEQNGWTVGGTFYSLSICTYVNLGFRRIWRILQIKGGVIHLGLRAWWIAPSFICRILHILLSLMPTWTKGVSYWSPSLTLSTNLESRALELIPTLTGEATLCCITKANTRVWAGWWANAKSLWCYSYGRACHGWNTWCSSHFLKHLYWIKDKLQWHCH